MKNFKVIHLWLLLLLFTANLISYAESNQGAKVVSKIEFERMGESLQKRPLHLPSAQKNRTTEAIVSVSDPSIFKDLEAAGATVRSAVGNCAVISFPSSVAMDLESIRSIRHMSLSKPVEHFLDQARDLSGVTAALSGVGPDNRIYTGKGVIVGIVDNGFMFSHVAFRTQDAKSSRITRVWNQTLDTVCNLKNFDYGFEYTDPAEIMKLTTDATNTSHGTHVAGIAAGTNYKGTLPYFGMATDAELVLVPCKGTVGNAIDGIKYIFDYAESVGKPCVVNLSLGTLTGPHDGTTSVDKMMESMTGPGKIIVNAAGNYGGSNYHVSGISTYRKPSLKTAAQFTSYSTTKVLNTEMWGEAGHQCKVQATVYDNKAEQTLYRTPVVSMNTGEVFSDMFSAKVPWQTDSIVMAIGIMPETNPLNNRPSATIRAVGNGVNKSNIFIIIDVESDGGEIHGWSDGSALFTHLKNPDYTMGDGNMTISELGGNAEGIITVGSFFSRNSYKYLNGQSIVYTNPIGSRMPTSSQGPTFDGRTKPDVTAPGAVILSSYSSQVYGFNMEAMVNAVYHDSKPYYYAAMSGTSMASPAVAGIVATWLEAKPDLTPADVKELISLTSQKDIYTEAVPNNQWGYGKIDSSATLSRLASGWSMISEISGDCQENAAVEYYTLDGYRLSDKPTAPGIYIQRSGSLSRKITIR